jgi:hypothetical protein
MITFVFQKLPVDVTIILCQTSVLVNDIKSEHNRQTIASKTPNVERKFVNIENIKTHLNSNITYCLQNYQSDVRIKYFIRLNLRTKK